MYDVDIIIPAYNSINTISIPLDSLKKQKTKYKFRVVIVNDNSSYSYKNILDKYSKYMFIEEIVLDKNGGPAVARQKGIDYTDSKYIMFIDSDDYLFSSDSIQKLVDNISLCNSDVAMGNFILERDNKEELVKNNSVWMHGKIYRRSFLEDNNIRFNTSRVNEDNGFNRLVVLLTKNISHLDEVVYVYKESQGTTPSLGNQVQILDNRTGLYYRYCHMVYGSISLNVGDRVNLNTKIGKMGNTGNSTGTHLHLEASTSQAWICENFVDPCQPLRISKRKRDCCNL